MMSGVTGSLSLKYQGKYYSLPFVDHGWMAADLVQYLEDVYRSETPEVEILKLLGYTLEINSEAPPRTTDHWVEVDVEARILSTNSELIRKAVKQLPPGQAEPYWSFTLEKVFEFLNSHDFTVRLYS